MNLKNLILPASALGLGLVLLAPAREAGAFSLIVPNFNLSQNQRDFRVFNNFTDSTANNNTVADPQFPGATGAVLAIWKASIEWGSETHGDGSGDPHQPGGLGSGNANFDPSYQGEALSVGGLNDNIHSELAGSSGGTLAFTESPSGNGWRIRYLSAWTWDDGPGTSIGNRTDLQGVACHEYGHALGLDHSGSTSATMFASINGTGVSARSINSDDRAGVQAIYGAASGSKPSIDSVAINGNTIVITGTNFSGSGNQVWFTQANAGGNGVPIKVTNLTSNGTTLSASIPATAGPGDVLVRNSGTGNDDLSNAFPTDLQPTGPTCPDPVTYCATSANSVGNGALIDYSGSSSVSANDLTLNCFGMPPNQFGIFFYGAAQTASFFGDGVLCVAGGGAGIFRLPAIQADAFGDVSMSLDLTQSPFASGPGQWADGTQWFVQYWYRDPAAGGSGFNLSNALDVNVCP